MKFYTHKPDPATHKAYLVASGIAQIFDGLVAVVTLGHVTCNYSMSICVWYVKQKGKRFANART